MKREKEGCPILLAFVREGAGFYFPSPKQISMSTSVPREAG
jgi:hypothetical protein